MKTTTGYRGTQIVLHWLVVLGVAFNYIVSEGMGRALHQRIDGEAVTVGIAGLHVWIGVAVLLLVLARIALLGAHGAPAAPGFAGRAARVMHGLLYLLLLAVPLGGALAWFGGIGALGDPHALLANVLLVMAGLHALMALWHHYVTRDETLMRMIRPRG